MKIKILTLLAVVCAGCSNSNENTKIDALSQTLDAVIQNQAAINTKLDALPSMKQIDLMSFYYHTNALNAVQGHIDLMMAVQETKIEDSVNSETRRVGVIIFTNVASFQADTLDALNEIKLHLR